MMQCTLEGRNARIFAKAIQSLSKFGSNLFVEADRMGLLLRSVNSTKSAIGTFTFSQNFFDDYKTESRQSQEIFCKLSMKACLAAFKNMKQVVSCHLKIDNVYSQFQVKLTCRLETVKNSLISIIDEENMLTTDVPYGSTTNSLIGSHRLFTEISNNFQSAEEEITLEATEHYINVKNYVEGSRVNNKFMRSSLKLTSDEFEKYEVTESTTVTFCLKEFRAFLLFAESTNESLIVNFYTPGSPVTFKLKKFDQIEGHLILSTLALEDISFYDTCKKSESLHENKEMSVEYLKKKRKTRVLNDDSDSGEESALFQFPQNPAENFLQEPTLFDLRENSSRISSVEALRNDSIATSNKNEIKDMSTISNTVQNSASFTAKPKLPANSEISVTFMDTESNPDCISQSPTSEHRSRGLRSIFSRCYETTYIPREPSPSSQVYVANSDNED